MNKRLFSVLLVMAVVLSMVLTGAWALEGNSSEQGTKNIEAFNNLVNWGGNDTKEYASEISLQAVTTNDTGSTAKTENSVAKVNINGSTTYYENILDAFAAADVDGQTATVTLLNDAVINQTDPYGIRQQKSSNIIFDLNGYTLSQKEILGSVTSLCSTINVEPTKVNSEDDSKSAPSLMVKDSSDSKTGAIIQPNGTAGIFNWGGTLTIASGTIKTLTTEVKNYNAPWAVVASSGTTTITGGTIGGKDSTGENLNGLYANSTAKVFLSGGTYSSIYVYKGTLEQLLASGHSFQYVNDVDNEVNLTIDRVDTPIEVIQGLPKVSYKDSNGDTKKINGESCNYIKTTTETTETPINWTANNWYAVKGTKDITGTINVSGEVNLILCDGASLNVTGHIEMENSAELTIYGQTSGTGQMTVNSSSTSAFMNSSEGASRVRLYGGTLTATGSSTAFASEISLIKEKQYQIKCVETGSEKPSDPKEVASVTISKCIKHELSYTQKENEKHLKVCTLCGYDETEACSYTGFKDQGDSGHQRVCVCGNLTGDIIQHYSSKYTSNDDGTTHSGKCDTCGHEISKENHTFGENGTCTCGARIAATYNNTDYANLQSAVNAAGQSEGTVQVKEHEVTQCITIENNQKLTLDLNGKTLDSTYHPLEVSSILMINGGQLTLKNGTVYGSSDTNARPAVILKGGFLILDKNVILEGGNNNFNKVKYPAIEITSNEASLTLSVGNKLENGMEVPEGKVLADYLSEGMAFAAGEKVINGYIQSTTEDLTVVTHTHDLINNECACGYTIIAKIGDVQYTSLQEAVNKVTNDSTIELVHDTTEKITVSSNIKLKGNGYTIGRLTVSGDITLKNLLADGYAYKNGDNWLSDSDLNGKTELTNVTIAKIPIESVTAENDGAVTATYGTQITLN